MSFGDLVDEEGRRTIGAAVESMAASCSLRMIQPATVSKPHPLCFYLRYCAETLSRAGMALHVLLLPSLLRVVAAEILKEPTVAAPRDAADGTAQLLQVLGAAAPAAALRAQFGRLTPTAEQHQLNQIMLRRLQEAPSLPPPTSPAPRPRAPWYRTQQQRRRRATEASGRKEASRSAEALWVETAALLLLDECEWAAAQALLLEAAVPLLEARADVDSVARRSLLLGAPRRCRATSSARSRCS